MSSSIRISEVIASGKLSPSNFKSTQVKRAALVPLKALLNTKSPYNKGFEPGNSAYVDKGQYAFLRNSCISQANYSQDVSKYQRLHHSPPKLKPLSDNDILLCKDANIGDTCLFVGDGNTTVFTSSGVVRLNFADEEDKYFCLAMLRDRFFRDQLDAITPKGSTIRHAGDLFLQCLVPDLAPGEKWVRQAFAAAFKNIAHAETLSEQKIEAACAAIRKELFTKKVTLSNPRVSSLLREKRFDAGFYSEVVQQVEDSVNSYKHGNASIEDFGFKMKRGPNLQKRDMGRSIQIDVMRPGYHPLVYPSSISDRGYILETSYIGARSLVWHIEKGGVLFSAEGTVGRTFAICSDDIKFITNIHGLIFFPKSKKVPIRNSTFLCMYFHFLRRIGYFDKVSVGGQGGSFAVGYWGKIKIPLFQQENVDEISRLYHNPVDGAEPSVFDISKLRSMGVYQLNNFRLKCISYVAELVQQLKDGTATECNEQAKLAGSTVE